ncbi:GntR family transcriptional regulator [Ottowia thiooxydans]|uniref:GntR family transcriptional regulator n=1 Tax=Ottowia thiooxydans TaxID=219182 RepID=UPI000415FB5C|nr:GntR family transcriptional regulator [Ottowia thiooxydans]
MSVIGIHPINKVPVEIQAAEALREAIVSGRISPGSRITEAQLAAELQLSRASARAALHQLAKEGLTSLIPYTGWTVATLSAADVWELYTLRSGLERLAAKLVVQTLSVDKSSALGAAWITLRDACSRGDKEEIAEADFALHKALIELSGHSRLKLQYETIERQIRMCIRSSDALVESPEAILEQHRPLVEAILAGRSDEAGAHAEAHNLTEGEKLREHLAKTETDQDPALRVSRGATRLRNSKGRKSA